MPIESLEEKVARLEHSNRVLKDALLEAQKNLSRQPTLWDLYASAALTGLCAIDDPSRRDEDDIAGASRAADMMLRERKKRFG